MEKVMYISRDNRNKALTVGKIYDVLESQFNTITILNDFGIPHTYFIKNGLEVFFIDGTLFYRNKKIDEILL